MSFKYTYLKGNIKVFFLDASFAKTYKHYLPDFFFFCLQLTLVIFLHRHSWYYLVMGSIDGNFGGYLLFISKRFWLMRYIM